MSAPLDEMRLEEYLHRQIGSQSFELVCAHFELHLLINNWIRFIQAVASRSCVLYIITLKF